MAQFVRTKNRTVADIGRQMIAPRAKMFLETKANAWVHHCKTNHSYQNQTGALEESISRGEVERTARGFQVEISAGGLSVIKYAFNFAKRIATGIRRRMKRGGETVNRGGSIYVDYAVFVEAKGYNVLLQGMEYIKKQGLRGLQIMRLPNG